MTPWLLVDYGEVISRPFDDRAYGALAAQVDLDVAELRAAYWRHRLAYDAGAAPADYWSRVAGRPVTPDEIEQLGRMDVGGWAQVDPRVLDLLEDVRRDGTRLALLSNAPRRQAEAYDRSAWAPLFEHLLVSSRLGLVKPDPAIFARALTVLGVGAGDATFVDDRPENVAAAASLGIRAIRYTGVDDLRRSLSLP